ncbi:hypothetical protein BDY21DRAFT_50342 [Lineolata rhizophorae]|uniref:WSC domain-containing protein n=1 Tax=Lineolata rhizophorae TaxID=578093 RepID=A0A6A6NXZ5_9PEZI|nr:hypothetical protein BDY21DRAFT_50342 [Lineolata rhizophorae]
MGPTMHLSRSALAAVASLLSLAATATALSLEYCSDFNTGQDSESMFWTWQSNGWCHDQCLGDYAFAVVQGNYCWCSDYIPANQEDTGDCDMDCPGFPDEKCGNVDEDLFGYIALPSVSPSGTMGPSPSSSEVPPSTKTSALQSATVYTFSFSSSTALVTPTSLSITYTPSTRRKRPTTSSVFTSESPVTSLRTSSLTSEQSPTAQPTSRSPSPTSSDEHGWTESRHDDGTSTELAPSPTSSKTPVTTSDPPRTTHDSTPDSTTDHEPVTTRDSTRGSTRNSTPTTDPTSSWTPTPVTSVEIITISGAAVTKTVTSTPTTPPEAATQRAERKLSGGAIAGIVIGVLGALALIALAVFFFCFYRRHRSGSDAGDDESAKQPPRRNTSVLSKVGLLSEKHSPASVAPTAIVPPVNLNNNGATSDSTDPNSPVSDKRASRPMFYDQRLNPSALMDLDNGSRSSMITMEDNRDYTRALNVRNPDPDGVSLASHQVQTPAAK